MSPFFFLPFLCYLFPSKNTWMAGHKTLGQGLRGPYTLVGDLKNKIKEQQKNTKSEQNSFRYLLGL